MSTLSGRIQKEELLGLRQLADAAVYAEKLVDADRLRAEFDSNTIRRKAFCEALGIGESTLSTWLQTNRIPRVASLAYFLWLALKFQSNELQRRDELAAEPFVIRYHDRYLVVQPSNAHEGDTAGETIGSFERVEHARDFAVTHSKLFRKALDQAIDALGEYEQQFEDDGEDNWISDRIIALKRARNFKVGPTTISELLDKV
jgi:hypothetical protein